MRSTGRDPYAAAGVDIAAGEAFVRQIAPLAATTRAGMAAAWGGGGGLLAGVGGFAAAAELPAGMRAPVLVAATDGVGSKLELARDCPAVIGNDVVAMCVNDLLCAGARPWLFLDYIACHKLSAEFAGAVVEGIAAACRECGCALVGGETAEMPDTYAAGKFDVAGFAVGIAEKSDLLPATGDIAAGDALVGIAANGAHSNGYALVRRILRDNPELADTPLESGETTLAALLAPTRLYCRAVAALRSAVVGVRGLAHVTGGGVLGNVARILPAGLRAEIDMPPLPPLFAALRDGGGIDDKTMRRAFNCGVGMVAVVAAKEANAAVAALERVGEQAWLLGHARAA